MQVVLLICFALVIVQLNNVSSTLTGTLDGNGDVLATFYDEEQMKVTTRSKLSPKDHFDISLKGTVSKMNNAAKDSNIRDIPYEKMYYSRAGRRGRRYAGVQYSDGLR
jgi:hypothetical protein